MIPDALTLVLLALAAFRMTRLIGWDTFPPVARARALLLLSWIEPVCTFCKAERADYEKRGDGHWVGLDHCPNCGSKDAATFMEGHGRPLLGELLECPFCLGWWVALAFYLSWLVAPTATVVVSVPLALGAAVGLLAKNLDP